ncbi:uncharacterized protein LOC110767787 isoform X2 [Prunus avium]|uniref:Uncharacterized protein LOC110767787 isoform X2 n=1 Tax=Prunus avium TaxID=42229 RepID=A0A6P5TIY5_PRUAV|nr:uncharacterized protein LOC110767787 isoform X2 [Prunus avium]
MEGPRPKGVESTKRHVTARPHAPSTAQQQQQEGDPLIYKPISLPPWKPRDTGKRKPMINMDLQQHSSMFKVRALVQQLRPNFIEVLQTPDFRNSKAADEIRKQIKLLMDLYKQMAKDAGDTHRKFVSETQHSTHDSDPAKENQDGKQQKHLQPRCSVEKPVRARTRSIPLSSDKKPVASQLQGSYIVGGSAFGWNFITFSGSKPIYYGVTKEEFGSRNNTSGTRSVV